MFNSTTLVSNKRSVHFARPSGGCEHAKAMSRGHVSDHVRPCSTAICAGRHGRGVEPQATCDAACSAHLRRRERGPAHCLGLLTTSRRPREMDATFVENQSRRIPPQASSAFVAAMEDVLAVYKRPRDGDCPLVCLDEASKQLLADTRVPIPMKPGQPERRDFEYERNGTANLFMMFAPLEGWRHVEITDRRTAFDYARALEDLSDRHFPNALS